MKHTATPQRVTIPASFRPSRSQHCRFAPTGQPSWPGTATRRRHKHQLLLTFMAHTRKRTRPTWVGALLGLFW